MKIISNLIMVMVTMFLATVLLAGVMPQTAEAGGGDTVTALRPDPFPDGGDRTIVAFYDIDDIDVDGKIRITTRSVSYCSPAYNLCAHAVGGVYKMDGMRCRNYVAINLSALRPAPDDHRGTSIELWGPKGGDLVLCAGQHGAF